MGRSSTQTVESSPQTPAKWWQWFLLYPALAVALLTSIPQWMDKALAVYHETTASSYSVAESQSAMWKKNLSCSAAPFAWYANPQNVRVDATICRSGDVFVRASTPENSTFFKWIDLNDVLEIQAKGGGLIPAAQAQVGSPDVFQRSAVPVRVQYQNAFVVCQRFLDPRRLMRHVRTPQGCFDEVIDTMNGVIIQRVPTPCRPSC